MFGYPDMSAMSGNRDFWITAGAVRVTVDMPLLGASAVAPGRHGSIPGTVVEMIGQGHGCPDVRMLALGQDS